MTGTDKRIAAACRARGLDLSATTRVGDYNERVAAPHRLDDFGDADTTVLLLGNTRLLWPAFTAALSRQPELLRRTHPLDSYVEAAVGAACADISHSAVRWAHRAEPAHLSFQTLAEVSGLAWRSPASLSVHPRFGPWIALRAAVTLRGEKHPPTEAMARPCFGCATGCEKRLKVLRVPEAGWQDWLAVRDACPLGREFRYSNQQIAYHYTKSGDLLRAALDAR